MEVSVLSELFQNVGLPIAIIVVLIVVAYNLGKRLLDQADQNMERCETRSKQREETLMEEIKENRRVNEKAIDTIAQYSAKLDGIQDDVKEIKQDISLMMMNGGVNNG